MRSSRGNAQFALLVALLGLLFWTAIGSNVIGPAFERDFMNLYTGGLLARTGHFSDMYDWKVQVAAQESLAPGLPVHFPYVRPPFYALMLAPMSLLPVKAAFPVWIGLHVAGMLLVWVWAWRRFGPDAMVYCAFFLPTSLGIAHGQDCIVLLVEMLGAWLLMERGKDRAAGLVLALTLFKFHLFGLLPLAMLLRRRWNLLGGYVAGGAALAGLSVALVGPAGVRGYIELLTRKDLETLSPSPEMMVGWNSMAVNLGLDVLWFKVLLSAAGAGVVIWSALKSDSDLRWFWTAVMGGMMLSPHTYEYDLSSLLIPAMVAAFTVADRYLRIASASALIPLPYFCTIAGTPWAIAPSLVIAAFFVALSGLLTVKAPFESRRRVGQHVPA